MITVMDSSCGLNKAVCSGVATICDHFTVNQSKGEVEQHHEYSNVQLFMTLQQEPSLVLELIFVQMIQL